MFKKIQDWLFKEDGEDFVIDEKDAMEELAIDESELFSTREEVKRKPLFERNKQQEENKVIEEDIALAEVTPQVVSKPKITIDITADEKLSSAPKVEATQPKQRPVLTRKEEFEMAPVISPYFGVKGEEKHTGEEIKLNAVPTHSHKKESFNTVISPFYGEKETKKEIRQTIYRDENNDLDKTFIEPNPLSLHEVEIDEDEDNIALDAIVSTPNIDDDDLIQFSLFGEAKKISDEEFENENSEINDNDELPF